MQAREGIFTGSEVALHFHETLNGLIPDAGKCYLCARNDP